LIRGTTIHRRDRADKVRKTAINHHLFCKKRLNRSRFCNFRIRSSALPRWPCASWKRPN